MIKHTLVVTLASTKIEVHVRLIYLIILCHTTELTPRLVWYFSADCMSHMISGSITLTTLTFAMIHALQLPIIFKPTLTCPIISVFWSLALPNNKGKVLSSYFGLRYQPASSKDDKVYIGRHTCLYNNRGSCETYVLHHSMPHNRINTKTSLIF